MVTQSRSRFSLLLIIAFFTLVAPACRVKEGCPTKDYTNRMDKKSKSGKSELFPKTMRKRMKN